MGIIEQININQILTKVLSSEIGLSDVKALKEKAKSEYLRPKLTPETIDEYSDWEIRVKKLARELSESSQAAYKLANNNIEKALLAAQVIDILAGLLTDSNAPIQSQFLLGYLHWQAGDYFDAIAPLKKAADGYHKNGDIYLEVTALSYYSDALHKTKDLDAALTAADHLIKRATECKFKGHIASALRDKGEILTDLGREKEALDCLKRAVEARRALSTEEGRDQAVASISAFINSLGLSERRFGHFEEAISAFLEVRNLEKSAGNLDQCARAISEIGYTYIQSGEEQRGLQYLKEASVLAEAAGAFSDADRWRTQVEMMRSEENKNGEISSSDFIAKEIKTADEAYQQSVLAEKFARTGQHTKALETARIVLEWAQMAKDFDLEITVRCVIANVLSAQEKLEEAVVETRRAIVVADRINHRSAMLLLRNNLANALLRTDKYQAANAVLTDGISRSQLLMAETESSEFRQSIMAETIRLYEQYAFLLSQFEYHDRLLQITELARARNFFGWIKARTYLESLTMADIDKKINQVLQELLAVEVELELHHITKQIDLHTVDTLKKRRKACQMQIEEWLRKFNLPGMPWELTMTDQDFPNIDNRLIELLQQNTAILTLFSVSEGVCALLIHQHQGDLVVKEGKFIPWDRNERLRLLSQWTGDNNFVRGTGKISLACREQPNYRSRMDSYLGAFRQNLINNLVSLVSHCNATRIAIIPNQELMLVPYWTLLDNCPGINSFTIAPSVNILELCQKRHRQTRGKTLLLQDPTGTLSQVPRELMLIRKVREDNSIFEPDNVEDLRQQAAQCTLIHLATHGQFDTENPYHSGIVVSERVDTDIFGCNKNDWRLQTAAEFMAKLSLNKCRLAVLSACETGIARLHSGGEMTGLPASLLIAGTKSVIASLWPVNDAATALLMDAFYSRWEGGRGRESSPAKALAEARKVLSTLTREDVLDRLGTEVKNIIPDGIYPFSHPFHTDTFQCYGSW